MMILNLRCRAPSPSIAFEHRIAEALEIILRKLTQIEGDAAGSDHVTSGVFGRTKSIQGDVRIRNLKFTGGEFH
jgi:hypothetical protein